MYSFAQIIGNFQIFIIVYMIVLCRTHYVPCTTSMETNIHIQIEVDAQTKFNNRNQSFDPYLFIPNMRG